MQLAGGFALLLLLADPALPIAAGINRYIQDVPSRTGEPTDLMGTTVDGVVVRQRSVQSKETPSALRAYFTERFQKAGLYMAPEVSGIQGQAGEQVTGLDADNMVTYSVLLQPNPKGTTVVVAAADLGHPEAKKTTDKIGPVYPGAGQVMTSSLEGMQMMTYPVAATPAEIKAFYREAYAKAGYAESGEMTFVKGSDKATVTVAPGLKERTVMVETGTFTPNTAKTPQVEKVAQ